MMILSIRTDKPKAEVGLFDYDKKLAYETWEAHRELSATIHKKILELLKEQNKTFQDLDGIVCFKGPGSFTGLRIGLTVANTLATELNVPIVGTSGKKWCAQGLDDLAKNNSDQIVLPDYGAPVHITKKNVDNFT